MAAGWRRLLEEEPRLRVWVVGFPDGPDGLLRFLISEAQLQGQRFSCKLLGVLRLLICQLLILIQHVRLGGSAWASDGFKYPWYLLAPGCFANCPTPFRVVVLRVA